MQNAGMDIVVSPLVRLAASRLLQSADRRHGIQQHCLHVWSNLEIPCPRRLPAQDRYLQPQVRGRAAAPVIPRVPRKLGQSGLKQDALVDTATL